MDSCKNNFGLPKKFDVIIKNKESLRIGELIIKLEELSPEKRGGVETISY